MNAQQQRVLESFRRIQGWFSANEEYVTSDAPGGDTPLSNQVRALNEIVERVMDYVTQQQTQLAQSLLVSKDEREQRREVLTHHMAPIARVAKALRGIVPGIGVLQMPRGNVQTAALVTVATVMARQAEVYAPALVEQGLPTGFLRQLTDAAAKLKGSLDARGLARGARASASRGLESELALGRRIVTIMDVTLARVLRNEPAKLAEWRHVQRVMVRGSVSRPAVPGDTAAPIAIEGRPTRSDASPTRFETSLIRSETSPIVANAAPIRAETPPIRREGSPIRVGTSPSGAEGTPSQPQGGTTLTKESPTAAVGSAIADERAA